MMSNTDLTKTGGITGSHEGKVVPASYKAPTMQHGPHKTGENTGSHEGKVVPASYKAPTMLLI